MQIVTLWIFYSGRFPAAILCPNQILTKYA